MNHTRNVFRFSIVVFWSLVLGTGYSVATNSRNAFALGWPSLLFYGSGTTAVLYIGAVVTKKTWNIK